MIPNWMSAHERKIQCALLIFIWVILWFCSPVEAGQLGANAIYLLSDHLPSTEISQKNSDGYRLIRHEMAKKSISDAQAAGFGFVRVALTGYRPIAFDDPMNDLAVWQTAPETYWAATDELFDELDAAHIRMVPTLAWNLIQFPALGRDDLATFLRDRNSRSRSLFVKFVTEFVTRYRSRSTVLFYELGNEWNLDADIDLQENCRTAKPGTCAWRNFTTDDLVSFSRDAASMIRSLDPSRKVSSGYSLPRRAASHLRNHFGNSSVDSWKEDSPMEFQQYLLYLNGPFDIVSAHIYSPDATRFGGRPGQAATVVTQTMSAVKSAGKQLFIGEFGDSGVTPFLQSMLHEIVQQQIDYAAIWVWEFYQTSTYETHNTEPSRFSIEPGYYDELIAVVGETEKALGRALPHHSESPNVILSWPLPCSKVDRKIKLAAVASDGARGVKSVEFFVNGRQTAVVASPPYLADFDPSAFGDENVEIEAKAIAVNGSTAVFKTEVRLNGSQASCHTQN
jgi:hypothetical protein